MCELGEDGGGYCILDQDLSHRPPGYCDNALSVELRIVVHTDKFEENYLQSSERQFDRDILH